MGKFYGVKIRSGERTLSDVPKLWLPSVKKWLKDNPEEDAPGK